MESQRGLGASLSSLQESRGNPATPANVAAALERMNDAYVERFGKELKMVKEGAVGGTVRQRRSS